MIPSPALRLCHQRPTPESDLNSALNRLQPYPFERLSQLLDGIQPPLGQAVIRMSIGEPRHPAPPELVHLLQSACRDLGSYPTARGETGLREAITAWLIRRFSLGFSSIDPEHQVLPLSGTREGLFAIAQTVVEPRSDAIVVIPNPFYQIYEGAALLSGAEPFFLNTIASRGFIPDLDKVPDPIWKRCQLIYLCSPGNPTGMALSLDFYRQIFRLSDHYGFVIAADECYSELYNDQDQPPLGALEAAHRLGRDSFERLVVFHSLSKRSSVPGLRSGFAAGDARLMERFYRYRTYHGCALPIPVQKASTWAWQDEKHVHENRILYRKKFEIATRLFGPNLPYDPPDGGFYLWSRVSGNDEVFARRLYAEKGVVVLPGSYLSRLTPEGNPGLGHVRISLVPDLETTREALSRIAEFLADLP